MRTILDTGPLVALLNKRDDHHVWTVEEASKLAPPFITCEAVLAEAHYLLSGIRQGRLRLIELLDTGRIELTGIVAANLNRIGELMNVYSNVPMDLADACLVAIAEQSGGAIFTIDRDFRIYRKNRDEPIKLIIPDGR